MDRLPKDLWVQIFLRLPVKIILRCLSVCKSWQLFIQHPSFIDSHLQHQRRDLMLVRSILPDNENKIPSYNEEITLAVKSKHEKKPECYSLYCNDDSFTLYAKHDFPILHPGVGHYRVVGTCNGVICVTNDEFGIRHETYLWNPTIQKCVEISYPEFVYEKIGPFDHELGFGFDEKTNDYKIIRIVQSDYDYELEVEICSLSTNLWRKASHLASGLNFRIFERYGSGRNYQVNFNGAVHWVCMDSTRSRCMVVVFHLSDEVFCCFEVPSDVKLKQDYFLTSLRNLRPIVFQGSLSLIRYSRPECSIWMMKNYGDSTSWAKYVDLKLSNYVDRVIGFRKKGEFLIEIEGGLYSYVPIEGKELTYLNERDIQLGAYIQVVLEGTMEVMNFVRQEVLDYDPEYAPKKLGIRSKTKDDFRFSFYSEGYTESLVLLGSTKSADVAELRVKEPEKIDKEDKNHGADAANDLQDLVEEGRQC